MKKELDDALCRDFPNLYRDRYGSPKETCMVWGFPGDGWEQLIRRASEKLEALILKLPKDKRHLLKAAQVKEKFGSLRYYMSVSNEEINTIIREAIDESIMTCETCGAQGKIVGEPWRYATCKNCVAEEDKTEFDLKDIEE